jgi:hypothetical protein
MLDGTANELHSLPQTWADHFRGGTFIRLSSVGTSAPEAVTLSRGIKVAAKPLGELCNLLR